MSTNAKYFSYILRGLEVTVLTNGTALVSWKNLSGIDGLILGPGSLTQSDASGEIFLGLSSSGTLVLEEEPTSLLVPLAWINGGDVFALWAHDGAQAPDDEKAARLLWPTSRTEGTWVGPPLTILPEPGSGFHYDGQNYPPLPGGPALPGGYFIKDFPGWAAGPGGPALSVELGPGQIAHALTSSFAAELGSQEDYVRAYWYENLGTDTGNTDLWGYNREPWTSVLSLVPELRSEFTLRTTPGANLYPTKTVWVSSTGLFKSEGPLGQGWVYNLPSNPTLLGTGWGLQVVNIKNVALESLAPGAAAGTTGTIAGVQYLTQPEVYEPVIDLRDFVAGSFTTADLVPGYKYVVPTSLGLPPGWVPLGNIAPGWDLGSLPRALPEPTAADYYHRKLNPSAFHHACDLLKLTEGKQLTSDGLGIASGPEDIKDPLRLWHYDTFEAGDVANGILGHQDATVYVRLPLHYKRDGKEWKLAQKTAESFLPLGAYEIGYHQFVADYSVAGEPIFALPFIGVERMPPSVTFTTVTPPDNVPT